MRWRGGCVKGWRGGGVNVWKDGGVEKWVCGKVEECKKGAKELKKRENVEDEKWEWNGIRIVEERVYIYIQKEEWGRRKVGKKQNILSQ